MYIKYIQGLCQSRLSTANYALFLVASLQLKSSHFNGRMLDSRED
jgi:hypothetical protein